MQSTTDGLAPEYVRDERWLFANLADLVEKYPDEWVAVLGEKVVAHGDSLSDVTKEVEAAFPNAKPVYWLVEGTPRVYTSFTGIR